LYLVDSIQEAPKVKIEEIDQLQLKSQRLTIRKQENINCLPVIIQNSVKGSAGKLSNNHINNSAKQNSAKQHNAQSKMKNVLVSSTISI
jgi:hypothetical protein